MLRRWGRPRTIGARARRLPYRRGRGRGAPGRNRSRLLPRRDRGSSMHVAGQPSDRGPARMAPLSVLPVFLLPRGRRTIVIGGNDAAAWKAGLLALAGAMVQMYGDAPSDEFTRRLAGAGLPGRHVHQGTDWKEADFAEAALVVADAATEADERAAAPGGRDRRCAFAPGAAYLALHAGKLGGHDGGCRSRHTGRDRRGCSVRAVQRRLPGPARRCTIRGRRCGGPP
jgi:hypothetical protein